MKFVLGGIYLFLFFMVMYLFGLAITKKRNYISSTLTGYIIYTAIMSLGIIPMQFLDFTWMYIGLYFYLLWIGIVLYIILRLRKNHFSLENINCWWRNYYFLFIIMGIMTILIFLNLEGYWKNNLLDDAYYLTKVSVLPYINNPFSTNYPVGSVDINSGLNTYLLNTWETEAAFYSNILHINPVLFCRLFLALQNYYLFLLSVVWCGQIINNNLKNKVKENKIQFLGLIIIFFGGQPVIYDRFNLLSLQDFWQYNSAMYYGATLVRTISVPLFIDLFIDNLKIDAKNMLYFIVYSIFLMSKSTVALPLIFILSISWLLIWWVDKIYHTRDIKVILIGMIMLLLFILFCYVVPDNLSLNQVINNQMEYFKQYSFLYGSAIVIFLSFFLFNKEIAKINIFLISLFLLLIIPELNDSFELFSVYEFVGARALAGIMYMVCILGYIYIGLFIASYISGLIYIFYIGTFLLYSFMAIGSQLFYEKITYNHSLLDLVSIVKNNSDLASASSLELSKSLNELSEKEEIVVESTEYINEYSYQNGYCALMRSQAPYVIEVTLSYRFPVKNDTLVYSGFSQADHIAFERFNITKDYTAFTQLSRIFYETGVNTFIVTGDIGDIDYSSFGYSIYKEIRNNDFGNSYTIFVRDEILES